MIIVSAFPGVGKTSLAENKDYVLDYDSGFADKDFFWAEKYVQSAVAVARNQKQEFVLVSSHASVRKYLAKNFKWQFVCVYPTITAKNVYLRRFFKRGDSPKFIDLMDRKWNAYIKSMQKQVYCACIELESDQFLSDVMPSLSEKTPV